LTAEENNEYYIHIPAALLSHYFLSWGMTLTITVKMTALLP